jgi:hypothetical protein
MRLNILRPGAMLVVLALVLAACASTPEPEVEPTPEPMGDFKLGFVVVVADNPEIGPLSREVTTEQIVAAFKPKLERKLRAFDGERLYNVAVTVEGYILAKPGIPVVASINSGIVVALNVWDDERAVRVTEEHKRFTVVEKLSGKSFLGSGLTQNKEQQLESLATSTVEQIMRYLRRNEDVFRPDSPENPPLAEP